MAKPDPCPCDPSRTYSDCCAPLLQGKRAADTAEELLRSRYSAFARGQVDYVVQTHHPKSRAELNRTEIEDWSLNSEWHGMQIHKLEGGQAADASATIVFQARYRPKPKAGEAPLAEDSPVQDHWEQSFFERAPAEGNAWRFVDARGVQIGTYRRAEPKVGRNDPCPCGSGKKFKKCCESAA